MREETILDIFQGDLEADRKDHLVHHFPGGSRPWSTEQLALETAFLAGGLHHLGVGPGDRVLILSDNRPEWHVADLAVLGLGAVDVPAYLNLTGDQLGRQAADCGAKVAIAEHAELAGRVLATRSRCPALEHVLQIEGAPTSGATALREVIAVGRSRSAEARYWDRARKVDASDLATIIYTSGTTGEPKGVMLSHGNLVANVLASAPRVPLDEDDLALEFLPLCHVFERMLSYVYMWRSTSRAYCSIRDVGALIETIAPTVFAGVPRFYEKVRAAVLARAAGEPFKAALLDWALGVGKRAALAGLSRRSAGALLGAQHAAADRLVLARAREALGGRVRFCVSGGAPLPLDVAEFFHAAGVNLLEGYGLTETSPVIAVNAPGATRLGSVGRPLESLEVAVADDGELLVRGPSVFAGYWNRPAETEAAFDASGFFRTGDIAELDEDGYLLITDRKKDILVTAGGKNVARAPIEEALARSPLVEAALLVGDHRRFVAALLAPSPEGLLAFAEAEGLDVRSVAGLANHPRVLEKLAAHVRSVNAGLARFEQVRAFRMLASPLVVETGELTPTLKVRRAVVEEENSALIDDMYASEQAERPRAERAIGAVLGDARRAALDSGRSRPSA